MTGCDGSRVVELTLSRCCDLVGGRLDLFVESSYAIAKIETMMSSSDRVIDVLHEPRRASASSYDLTALAPFQTSGLVFPSTRSTMIKIVVTFRDEFLERPPPTLRLYGCKYFVDAEHRKSLFTESHVLAVETRLAHPRFFVSSTNADDIVCKLDRDSGRTVSLSIATDAANVRNVRLSLEEGFDVYNGPVGPLLDVDTGRIELRFSDPACKNYRSLIDLKKHPNAALVLTMATSATEAAAVAAVARVVSTRLEFIAYSSGTMSYALLLNDS